VKAPRRLITSTSAASSMSLGWPWKNPIISQVQKGMVKLGSDHHAQRFVLEVERAHHLRERDEEDGGRDR